MNVIKTTLHSLFRLRAWALLFFAVVLSGSAFAGQQLKVFILAGQSNTVGHARGHTIATLYRNGMTKDKALARMVFTKDMSKAFEEQLVKARKLDELSGGIGLPTIKRIQKYRSSIHLVRKRRHWKLKSTSWLPNTKPTRKR